MSPVDLGGIPLAVQPLAGVGANRLQHVKARILAADMAVPEQLFVDKALKRLKRRAGHLLSGVERGAPGKHREACECPRFSR